MLQCIVVGNDKAAHTLVPWPLVVSCVAVCCSALQCVAVHCRALQCVAVCCSVLQCAAASCSVLQCVMQKQLTL